jgi:hypothetical protein
VLPFFNCRRDSVLNPRFHALHFVLKTPAEPVDAFAQAFPNSILVLMIVACHIITVLIVSILRVVRGLIYLSSTALLNFSEDVERGVEPALLLELDNHLQEFFRCCSGSRRPGVADHHVGVCSNRLVHRPLLTPLSGQTQPFDADISSEIRDISRAQG